MLNDSEAKASHTQNKSIAVKVRYDRQSCEKHLENYHPFVWSELRFFIAYCAVTLHEAPMLPTIKGIFVP